jgi:hypothetical protein
VDKKRQVLNVEAGAAYGNKLETLGLRTRIVECVLGAMK